MNSTSSSTTDNTAQTWRDLTDQLTAEQISQIENGRYMQPDELLDIARDYAARNLLQVSLADVAAPAGTTEAGAWYYDDGETATRSIYAGRWRCGNVIVVVAAEQSDDGAATWQIEVREAERTDGTISAGQARELALVLTDAADLLDKLGGENTDSVGNPYPLCCSQIPCPHR